MTKRPLRVVLLAVVMGLVLAACGGTADDTTTTTAAASETTTANENPTTTEGTESSSPSTTAAPMDDAVTEAMARSWRVGISGEGVFHRDGRIAEFQLNKLPAVAAIMALNDEGWDVAPIFLNQSEAPVQALIQGSVDVANSSVTPVITAAAAGASIKAFAKTRNIEYIMLTTTAIESPEDLDGARVGLHAAASTTSLLTKLLLADYPDVEPTYLIVPGSGNRIQAMLAGELDATAAQFGDDTAAMEAAPGEFHVIFDFATEMPQLVDSVLTYNPAELDDATQAFLEHLLAKTVGFNRMVYEDPEWAQETAESLDVDETGGLDRYISSQVFPKDHGLDAASLDFTIQGLIDSELIPADVALSGSDLYDESIWDGAKAILGE